MFGRAESLALVSMGRTENFTKCYCHSSSEPFGVQKLPEASSEHLKVLRVMLGTGLVTLYRL